MPVRKRSEKEVIPLDKIIKKFEFRPSVTIEGSVNGKNFCFEKGKWCRLSYGEYEVIAHSSYAHELGH